MSIIIAGLIIVATAAATLLYAVAPAPTMRHGDAYDY
jgi:hypothetical protein